MPDEDVTAEILLAQAILERTERAKAALSTRTSEDTAERRRIAANYLHLCLLANSMRAKIEKLRKYQNRWTIH